MYGGDNDFSLVFDHFQAAQELVHRCKLICIYLFDILIADTVS